MTKMKTDLFCLHCDRETRHVITYLGPYLNRIRCEECGTELALDRKKILEGYAADTIDRVFTKPLRMTEEMRKHLTAFITSLPIRIMTKPYRMAKEIMGVVKEKPKGKKR